MITRKDIESAPSFTIFEGPADQTGLPREGWELFWLDSEQPDNEVDEGAIRRQIDYQAREPQIDQNDFDNKYAWDDIDAALAYLNEGGKLVKLPDAMGSPYWRLYCVGAPEEDDDNVDA